MQEKAIETFCPNNREAWRLWLQEHHRSKQSIWLVYYKKQANVPTVSYSHAVDEALCFGWIDSTRKSLGDDRFMQFFCKRKPKSGWSKVNKEKIEQLIEEGLMTPAGYECIERAKQNGSWASFDEIEALTIPSDLEAAFQANTVAADYFLGLSKSARKIMLHWLAAAKRPETRQKRLNELVEMAAQRQKPKQFIL